MEKNPVSVVCSFATHCRRFLRDDDLRSGNDGAVLIANRAAERRGCSLLRVNGRRETEDGERQ